LEFVEEEGVGKQGLRFNGVDRDSVTACMALIVSPGLMEITHLRDSLPDRWMNGQAGLWNLHILLEMQ
jgi:hypothetical protein